MQGKLETTARQLCTATQVPCSSLGVELGRPGVGVGSIKAYPHGVMLPLPTPLTSDSLGPLDDMPCPTFAMQGWTCTREQRSLTKQGRMTRQPMGMHQGLLEVPECLCQSRRPAAQAITERGGQLGNDKGVLCAAAALWHAPGLLGVLEPLCRVR